MPRVVNQHDLQLFIGSKTYVKIITFIENLRLAAQGKDLRPATRDGPKTVERVIELVASTVAKFPTKERSSRFGKPEFVDFYDHVQGNSGEWLKLLGVDDPQVAHYFNESWGNRKRIDYGSGHELNFLCFLISLFDLDVLGSNDYEDVVLSTFSRYLTTMRQIQKTYWLEPAGSHGVWGLDDYHFLPFLFGSAQLVGHKFLRPLSIHDEEIVAMYAKCNYYFACINFINGVKSASLRWHSPMLDDISAAKSWDKIAAGMLKMYKAEVLGKLPIMQHFVFSTYLPAPEGITEHQDAQLEHVHGWGDCCGIKVPSAIAGAQQEHRILPFD